MEEVLQVPPSLRGSVEFCSSRGLLHVFDVLAWGVHKMVPRHKLHFIKFKWLFNL